VILALVLGNAIFVAAEYALVTARRARLEVQAEAGSRAARTALRLMDEPVRFISTVQVAITIFGILLGAVGEPYVSGLLPEDLPRGLTFVIAFVILTYLSVVLGELVPKAVSLQKAETMALALAVPLYSLGRFAYPLVWILQGSANRVARLFGVTPAPGGIVVHTEEDIRQIVAEAEESGVIEEAEEEMLYRVFDFADKEARDVMVARPGVVALSVDLPPSDCLAAVIDSPYTRYPVYRGSLDDILGILHVRDLFSAMHKDRLDEVVVGDLVRPAHVVPETKDLGVLLSEFRRTNQHMAIVIDEYGSFEGIVTLEDVLEEIVGEIEDEFDLPDGTVERIDDRRIRIAGTYPIDDFNEEFDQALPQDDFHTMAGFVFGALGRSPHAGDEVEKDSLRFHVLEVEGKRIMRLDVEFLPPADPETEVPAAG